ncbi:MAG: hypothetical protein ACRDZR_02240 [Acidimicrobiales bacterium]
MTGRRPRTASVTPIQARGAPYVMPDGSKNYRPPFEEGNTLSVRHGLHSERITSERYVATLAELREDMPWLETCDAVAVEGLARALATFRPLDTWITAVMTGEAKAHSRPGAPDTGVEAVPERVWRAWRGAAKLVQDATSALGMSPVARAGLMRDTGWARALARQEGFSRLTEQGRAMRSRQR